MIYEKSNAAITRLAHKDDANINHDNTKRVINYNSHNYVFWHESIKILTQHSM